MLYFYKEIEMKRILFALSAAALLTVSACGNGAGNSGMTAEPAPGESGIVGDIAPGGGGTTADLTPGISDGAGKNDKDGENSMDNEKFKTLFEGLKLSKAYKNPKEANPIMVQYYGADPCAMVYKDRVYIYMTADSYEYDATGNIKENGYGTIKSIRIVSTDDLVNYTDHGSVNVAGTNGACKWARNSWAPTAAWKNIDGVDRFFLYFADSGNGIGVLTADSPTGPFTDVIGHALVNRSVENCANIPWLFDPAVLVDDDGTGYLYFGGGVPEGQAAHPSSARCVRLGADMMSLDSVPQTIDPPYLFEDSGIHKFNGKYYYSYCTNFSVDEAGAAEYGFQNGEISVMVSDSPLGPFTFSERVLRNPGAAFGLGGNNHHSIFCFKDKWYITYHTRLLEKNMGIEKGYRCSHVNGFEMGADGKIGLIKMDAVGPEQVKQVDARTEQNAACGAILAGLLTTGADTSSKAYGCGTMALSAIDPGDYLKVRGVDFGSVSPRKLVMKIGKTEALGKDCVIKACVGLAFSDAIAYVPVGEALADAAFGEFVTVSADIIGDVTGVDDLFFVFAGSGYEVLSWRFE